ncbi:MAG TPA: dTMP kinase [Rhodobiaceae bacterium]|jgi:dTMP kinase|nr:MAG: dTMP kinase [Rhizobiales bacterium TMED29]HAL85120.1 dTMP kinase [Rhodobiaceae bacterium]
MRGKFITFEGGEGGGKSTQAARMAGYLRGKGLEVIETREPGGTPQGEDLRDLLVQGDPDRWSALSELLLLTAARVEHVNRLIEPALAEGKWVICDRFADSTLAYQGIAGELGLELVEQLQQLAVGASSPDVTFLLDVRAEAGLQRAEKRGGAARFEKKGAAFHQTLRDGFLALANENPQRIVLIDGEDTFDNVWGQIEAELGRRFKL